MSVAAQPASKAGSDPTLAESITERLSQELIIALVGPVGSGVSTVARYLEELLKNEFGYTVAPIIKASDIIKAEAKRVGVSNISSSPLSAYIDEMQTAGNKLREEFGADYLAEKAVERIYAFRRGVGGIDQSGAVNAGRRAYIIDSLKNMEELALLRKIYRDTLCVFGVFAPDEMRKSRLINNSANPQDVQKILDRDQGELATFGQMTRKVFIESDFFICNDQKIDEVRRRTHRFLELVFDTNIHTPSNAESAMFQASASEAKSACLSRQVGAAIISSAGELIGIGWNDVPKFGGRLYTESDQSVWDPEGKNMQDRDHRCFKWGARICHNDARRSGILSNIAKLLAATPGLLGKGKREAHVLATLKGTDVDSLTEFSRSIHAEMEAIVSVAREGKNSIVGSTLYCTVYPCHNCARHIVAAGITEVVYIHPYKKSLAAILHSDAITEDPADKSRVRFRQYDGVAPQNYRRLFKAMTERKDGGRISRPQPTDAVPVFRVPLDAPVLYESKVIADLAEKEHNHDH